MFSVTYSTLEFMAIKQDEVRYNLDTFGRDKYHFRYNHIQFTVEQHSTMARDRQNFSSQIILTCSLILGFYWV